MAVRGVRAVHWEPSRAARGTAGIAQDVGSSEVGKQADLIAITGDPIDPRSSVEMVWIRGRRMYDTRTEARRW